MAQFDRAPKNQPPSFPDRRRIVRLMGSRPWLLWYLLVVVAGMSACAESRLPSNYSPTLYDPEKSALLDHHEQNFATAGACPEPGTPQAMVAQTKLYGDKSLPHMTMRYSPGDRLNLLVPGAADFSGDYVVNADGRIILPFAREIRAVGRTNYELANEIRKELVDRGLFTGEQFRVAVRPVQYAPVNVSVAGAVFLPGRFTININRDSDRGDKALTKFGDSPTERFIGAALRAAGGVRPDADLTKIRLVRRTLTLTLDWRGAILGGAVDDVALIEGDHLEVGETGCFQSALVRPSQITPPGIRVFQSNLTSPTNSNASAAISQVSQSIPYGSRFLQGLVSANCVGGSLASNASRFAVLISRNPKTHRTEVIQRSIEELVRSAHRDTINPYLMPDDAIACYDSAVVDAKEFAVFLQTLLLPLQTSHVLRTW